MSGDEEGEVEEGQLVATPGECSRTPSPGADRNRKSKSPRMSQSTRVAPRKSRSKSPTKNRNRSRSRSNRRSMSRDGKRRADRRRSRSRSRSGSRESYHGPIIRDMRRGRGGRPFNRGVYRGDHRGGPRGRFGRRDRFNDRYNRSRSRSRSRSGSRDRDRHRSRSPPKTAPVVEQYEKSLSPQPKGAQPSDIKNLSKAETSSFIAMLQQKKVNKLIPINIKSKNPENEGSHGFVSTFATVGQKNLPSESRGSSGDDDEDGTEVNRSSEMKTENQTVDLDSEKGKESDLNGTRKRSRSRSSDQSDREKSKRKKAKKHKHKKKSKRRVKDDSDGSEVEKKSKRKSGDGIVEKKDVAKKDGKEKDDKDKKKDKKRKRKRRHRSSSEDSDRERSKKKAKKSKRSRSDKKKKKKRKKSSSHSESNSSESEDEKVSKVKKDESKKDESKKDEKRKHKSSRTKDAEPQVPVAQTSVTDIVHGSKKNECVDSERKEDSFEYPKTILKYTKTQPTIRYCHNPRTLLMDPTTDVLPKSKVLIPLDDEKEFKLKEKNDSGKKVRKPSGEGDSLTPSEKRNLEKKKKEEQQKLIQDEVNTASSSYYRPKKDSKKDENSKDKESESIGKKEDKEVLSKIDDGNTSSIRKSSKAAENESHKKHREPEDSIEEKKKKLLEKVREKKEVTKADGERSEKRMDISSMIGKIPKKKKSQAVEKNPVNMNSDYSYYQQSYIYNYGYDIYTAAYYAQYMMVTSGDYSQEEIQRWLESNGYKYDYAIGQEMPQLPPTETEQQGTTPAQEAQPIGVVVPDVPVAAHEMYFQSPQSDSMDVDSEEDGNVTPSPPPPPPPGPKITALTVTEPFSLPDGTSVPTGTKQVIVHPYSDTHPFASEFTPDAIKSKLQKQSNEGNSNGLSNQ